MSLTADSASETPACHRFHQRATLPGVRLGIAQKTARNQAIVAA
jgi:hypothetical protein